jgi:hypothetical protein
MHRGNRGLGNSRVTVFPIGGTRPSYAELRTVRLHPKMESGSHRSIGVLPVIIGRVRAQGAGPWWQAASAGQLAG